jgi:hypothetical protein
MVWIGSHHVGRVWSFVMALLLSAVLCKWGDAHDPPSTTTTTKFDEISNVRNNNIVEYLVQSEIIVASNAEDSESSSNRINPSLRSSASTQYLGTDACFSATTCENCTSLSRWYGGCHWCSHDQSCHTIGSYYGCAFGTTCGVTPNPNPPLPPGEDKSCYAQETCRDCALLSSTCHWCAHDNKCHVIGSVSGCVTGVDCYNNDRCQRKQPEPLPDSSNHMHMPQGVASIPLIILFVISGLIVCCATICCCVAGGVKGAYDELADLTTTSSSFYSHDVDIVNDSSSISTPLISNISISGPVPASSINNKAQSDLTQPLVVPDEADVSEEDPLLSITPTSEMMSTTVQTIRVNNTDDSHQRRHHRSRAPKSMSRLYSACVFCYLIIVFVAVTISIASVRYYPQAPVYSICNDNLAWKSLIDSLTSMKVTADFEILASISNPNYMDVALDMGQGSFSHNGAFVGTYDIPPTIVTANAITDILIVAHLMPDKWDALSLTAEYYRGKLVLQVDASVTVRIPILLNYTFSVKTQMAVNVNEQSDRSLCSCPTWNDPTPNQTRPIMLLPDFLTEKQYTLL